MSQSIAAAADQPDLALGTAPLAPAPEAQHHGADRPAAEARAGEERLEMPLPSDPRVVFQGGLFLIGVLVCLYLAQEVILPVVVAFMLKLLLQPLVRLLERVRVPKGLGALIGIALLIGVFVGLGMILSAPATAWAEKLPRFWPTLQEKFGFVQEFAHRAQEALGRMGLNLDAAASGGTGGGLQPTAIATAILGRTGSFAGSTLEMLLVLFYLLVFGETFLRRTVEILPRFSEKREAVELSMHIERDLSAYMVTITAINAVVGVATALVMWATGVPGPVLWGVAAFCLNYVPILGPVCGIALFAAVGLLTKGAAWGALLPAGLYFGIHVAEGEIITPMLLARRFTINPIAVIVSLIFWYWMWGVPGAILSVPMLAVMKIICDRLRPLRAFGHLLEG